MRMRQKYNHIIAGGGVKSKLKNPSQLGKTQSAGGGEVTFFFDF